MSRSSLCAAIMLFSFVEAGLAQPAQKDPLPQPPPVSEILQKPQTGVILGPAPKGTGKQPKNCIEVEINGERSFDCTNERLKDEVDRVAKVPNVAPLDAHSADIKIGTFNQPAIQQQFGQNFGKSTTPYRPGATYSSPLNPPPK